jgi:MFS family permease
MRARLDIRRVGRCLAVTLGLMVAGALLGGIAGGAGLLLATLVTFSFRARDRLDYYFATYIGALIGTVMAPVVGGLLLRRTPLGKAIAWTVVGTIAGGVAGWIVGTAFALSDGTPQFFPFDDLGSALVGASSGTLIGALVLRYRTRSDLEPVMTLAERLGESGR